MHRQSAPLLQQAAEKAIALAIQRADGRPPMLGIAGAQGSGKSTLAETLVRERGAGVAVLSLDDVYLMRDARRRLAETVHPLLATRGPPGTHDLPLLNRTLDQLVGANASTRTPLPRFDKLTDDRERPEVWPVFVGRPELILVDGWCVGALPPPVSELAAAINDLERGDDPEGIWRSWVHQRLAVGYAPIWSRFDAILALDAPSFDVVAGWRTQQEEGLLGRPLSADEPARIRRFIQHFERITRSMLAGYRRADVVVQLDATRTPVSMSLS